ncbi:MAG: DMT family transporter, partial [Acidobacteriota bacterium]|nr:DMT family transporter [Acidobacteriota bacterium]
LHKRDLVPATFWIRTAVTTVFALVLLWRVAFGATIVIRDGGALFGIESIHLPPIPTFLIYLLLNVLLITCVTWLYFRALQISPLSMCVPFLSFTPVFLIFTGFLILGEIPPAIKALGVMLIVLGSLVMHRKLFAQGPLAPIRAVLKERGSRYMLVVSLIFAITNPIDKKLVTMSDVFTEAFAYGFGLSVSFWIMGRVQGGDFAAASRDNWKWISLAGVLDAVSLLFQLASYAYIAVVITVSIKRAGIILAVFSGWLFFHERGITDQVIAASVMFCGVLILYLPVNPLQAAALTLITIMGMSTALYLTRNQTA